MRVRSLAPAMPTYKLYYFNSKGSAEPVRLIFAQAGVAYEDVRLTSEQWAEFKPRTPYGAMPVLEVDGKMLGGSQPIARYLTKQFGMAGEDDFSSAILDGAVDASNDIVVRLLSLFFEKDDERKAAMKKELEEKVAPRVLGGLEKLAAANNCADGWFYGPKMTYADIIFIHTMNWALLVSPDILDNYPALKKLKASVENAPNIAKWIKERPVTEY